MKRSFFLLLATWAGVACAAQAQLPEPGTTSREQQLVETIGLERITAGIPLTTLTNVQNVTGLLQSGIRNTARIDQQNLATVVNQAYVAQIGTANVLNSVQLGSNNRLFVNQTGSNNQAGYIQDGQNNSTTIAQNGSQNKVQGIQGGADLLLEGNNNTMKITQKGDFNTVEGKIQESNRKYEIIQHGYENKLIQVESTMQTPVGYTVEMRGRGINMTIEQSKVVPGVR